MDPNYSSLAEVALFFRFAVHSKLLYFSTEPLIPYNVTVVAVNLAGPGEQKTTNFFTRQGGVFLTNCVYGKLLINFCVHFVDNQSST